jgi:hypothetical protein
MRTRTILVPLLVWLAAGAASAQELSLEFREGVVRLTATNVPASRILSEWTRVGGTRIVNAERVPGAPLTLLLIDVPERQALDIVLRSAAGYLVTARETPAPGASAFDKILVLPTTTRVLATPSATSTPSAPPPPQALVPPVPIPQVDLDDDDEPPDEQEPGPGAGPRGPVPASFANAPPQGQIDDAVEDDDDEPPATPPPASPAPGKPSSTIPGAARPGGVTPPPPPPDPKGALQRILR